MSASRPKPYRRGAIVAGLLLGFVVSGSANADDPPQIKLNLKDHRFTPAEVHVQAGKPVVLLLTNEDDTAEEFDSTALKVEKIVAAGHYATIRLRPLAAGRYPFMGEFHPDTANGVVVSE